VENARDLAKDGGTLILSARDRAGLERTAEAVRAAGSKPVIVAGDMSKAEDREALVAAAEAEGPIDVFVNNAGVEYPFEVTRQSTDQIEQTLDVNLAAPILLARRMLPAMVARKRGCMVFVASLSGKAATPYNSVYSASKFGLVGFVHSVRFELQGSGVHLGLVCPGFVKEAGMFAVAEMPAPALMPAVPIAKVVRGVRRVMSGEVEVIVNSAPIRPVLALSQLAPSIGSLAVKAFGVVDTMRRRAQIMYERHRSA
jgi:short-subunit dehydrogenase